MTAKTTPSIFTVSAARLQGDLHFYASPRDPAAPAFIIHADGRVTVPDNKAVDDAARAFWSAVRRMNPYLPKLDREQCVRIIVAKLMSHHGFELVNPNADVLQLDNPRARAWVSQSREIVDALCASQQE